MKPATSRLADAIPMALTAINLILLAAAAIVAIAVLCGAATAKTTPAAPNAQSAPASSGYRYYTTHGGACIYRLYGQDGTGPVLLVLDKTRSSPECRDFSTPSTK